MASLGAYIHEGIKLLYNDPKAAAAAVGGGAAVYGGVTAGTYNKANFVNDEEKRFTRFGMARANMCAQVGQYRFDIRGMTNVTVTKAHVFCDTAQLFMCTSAALSCAGRIGMHGSAPPGWLCALYTGHIFLGAMYLTVCLWLGFHCSLRAQCGMVSLLTRKVRLPIPSLNMINNARVFGSSYERQKVWDIVRFPWVSHPFDAPEIPGASSDEEEGDGKGKTGKKKKTKPQEGKDDTRKGDYAASDAFGSTGRASVPSWIRDEQVVDKGVSAVPRMQNGAEHGIRYDDPHEVPDHFRLFAEAQKEWFPYETYHKIAMLYGVMCFFHGVCYYCIIYAMSELRGFWIAWAVPLLFMTAQYWLMQMDIFKAHGQQFLRGFEMFGHIAPYFAVMACTCEYRAVYSKAQVGAGWAFAIASLASHMLFACRFFDLMTPDTMAKEMDDEDGKSWWPKSWPVPLAFVNTLWQITPPRKLKKGQHCLLHEAINLERQNGGVCKVRRRRGKDGSMQMAKGEKASKRQMAQKPEALLAHASELEHRFRSSWHQIEGKDQSKLNQIYGRWVAASREAQLIHKEYGGSDGSGSGSESSGSGKSFKAAPAAVSKITEVAEELATVEELLIALERTHQVVSGSTATKNGDSPIDIGTSTRGLPTTPYWIMRAAVSTHIFIWFFIIVCTSVEVVLGTQSPFAPPGEPPWIRNQKMRPYQADKEYLHLSTDPLPSWYRLFVAATIPEPGHSGHDGTGADRYYAQSGVRGKDPATHGSAAAGGHSGGHGGSHRRLQGDTSAFNDLFSQLPALDWLAQEYLKHEGMEKEPRPAEVAGMLTEMEEESSASDTTSSVPSNGFMAPSLQAVPVDWPPLFEPQHLACQTRASGVAIAALTPRGFGALLHVTNSSNVLEGEALKPLAAQQFALSGISAMGPLVGVSWTPSGLHLVAKSGHLLHCPGHVPTDGAWSCQRAAGPDAPISPGSTLRAGAVTEHASGRTLALLFDNMPKTVVLYKEHEDKRSWLPSGEVHLPPGASRAALGFSEDTLMLVRENGAVHHRPLRDGVAPFVVPAPTSSVSREWHDACPATVEGGIIRLALRQSSPNTAAAWRAELVMSAKAVPLVNV